MMNRYYNFPSQMVSNSIKRTDKWQKEMIDEIIKLSYHNLEDTYNKLVNYDLYNGIINESDFTHVTAPYGEEYSMPVKLNHFDIIVSKMKVLEGENIKRPMNFKVKAINELTVTRAIEEQKEMLISLMEQELIENMKKQAEQNNLEPQEAQARLEAKLKELGKYITYNYKEASEKVAQELLEYLIKKTNCKREFAKGFKDQLVVGQEIYWVGIEGGMPVLRALNPVYFSYDKSSSSDFIQDAQWATYTEFLLPAEIIGRYGDKLTQDILSWVDNGKDVAGRSLTDDITYYRYDGAVPLTDNYYPVEDGIKVTTIEWKSLRKVGFLKYTDQKGYQQEVLVDESYKKKMGEKVKWKWVPEVWRAIVLQDEHIIECAPVPNQYRSVDNPFECSLSFVGFISDDRNSRATSMMDRLKPYQYEFDIMMYRLEQEIAKSKGKKLIFDVAQLPRSGEYAMNIEQWMYYADTLGIVFFNSREEDKKGNTSSFNQFKDLDLTMSQSVGQILEICRELDERARQVSGVTHQREGQIGPTELATNAERAVVQSATMTEWLFYNHDQVRMKALEKLLEVAKVCFKDGNKQILNYITDDFGVKYITMDPEVFNSSDYGLFMSSSNKDSQLLAQMQQYATVGLQAGTLKVSDVMVMMSMDNVSELRNTMEQKEKEAEERQAQAEQQQAQMQKEAQERAAQLEEQKIMLERMKLEIEAEKARIAEENNIRDNQTALLIKQMELGLVSAELNMQDNQQNKLLSFEDRKLNSEIRLKEKELEIKDKSEDNKVKIARSKPKTIK